MTRKPDPKTLMVFAAIMFVLNALGLAFTFWLASQL